MNRSAKFTNDPLFVKRSATFSACRSYRYTLDIIWDESKPLAVFIGLNPSTADENQDDPTIRRCRGFAESWGCGGMRMLNLFAYRATDPAMMKAHPAPIEGAIAQNWLEAFADVGTGPVVACWGTHGEHLNRGAQVAMTFAYWRPGRLQCFGRNADGTPKHPLYLKGSTKLEEYVVQFRPVPLENTGKEGTP